MGDTTEDETIAGDEAAAGDDGDSENESDTTEDESDTSINNDDDDESDDDSEDGDDKGKGDSEETDTADEEAEADDGAEPELRKPKIGASNKEWAAYRKQQKEKRQRSGEADENDDDAEDSDDDDLSEEDRRALDKRIEKQLAPFKKQAAEQEVETEIASFLAKNPDFKPFEAKVRRWALHPNREGVPVKSIFYEVAGEKLMALGAKRAKAADLKANRTKTPKGGGDNAQKGSKSYKDMPLADFGKELEAAKLGR